MLNDFHYRWFGIIPKGIKVAAMLDDVHSRWFGIIPKGIKVAAMLDDVHSRWFGIIPKGIKWQPCWMMFTLGGLESFLRE